MPGTRIRLNADFIPAYVELGRAYERLGSIGGALAQSALAWPA